MKLFENLKTLWARNKPIIISVFISVIEIALFLYFSLSEKSEDTTLIKALQPYLGGYITTLVTTWYVIFTYFILKANVDMRNFNINPFLTISWIEDSNENSSQDSIQINNFDCLANQFKSIRKQILKQQEESNIVCDK